MKYLERIYPWLLLSPVLLPVVVWGELVYPYLVPKTLLFYALTFITVGVFALLVSHGREFYYERLTERVAWIPLALLVLAYVASYFGLDFYRSFWSVFVRGDGLLMLTCAVANFYLILLFADVHWFKRLLYGATLVGSAVALYGIGEWFIGGGRIGSLLGNAAFFAGYLGLTVFATLAASTSLPTFWRNASRAGAVLQVIAIVLTATRGTLLALLVAAFAALGYTAYALRGKWRSRAVWLLVALIGLGGFFVAFRSNLTQVPFEPIARVAAISRADSDVASRLFIWKNMVGEIRKHPWLGIGGEHVDALFNSFYDPTEIAEQWFDRSHNAFLDYAAQYGVFGLLLYLALIGSFFTVALRLVRKGYAQYAAVATLLGITYGVQNFFVFDTISSFWLILALLASLLAFVTTESPRRAIALPTWSRPVSWVLSVALLLLIIPVSVRPLHAAYDVAQAYHYQLTDVEKEVSYLSHGYALGTYGDVEYGYEAYDMYSNTQASLLKGQSRIDAYQAALSILTSNFNRYPYDARTAIYLAHVLSLAPEEVTIDQNLLSEALERAIRLSPKRAQPWYILVNLSLSSANSHPVGSAERTAGYAAAHDLMTRYIALVPKLSEPYFVLTQLEYASGDTAAAAASAALGKMYYRGDLETAKRAAVYYETVLDLPDAAYFLSEVVHYEPSNAAAASDLANILVYEQSKH